VLGTMPILHRDDYEPPQVVERLRSPSILIPVAVALIWLAAQPSLVPTLPGSDLRIFWISEGILLAALMLTPRRIWPAIAVPYCAIALSVETSLADLAYDVALVTIIVLQMMVIACLANRGTRRMKPPITPSGGLRVIIATIAVSMAGGLLLVLAGRFLNPSATELWSTMFAEEWHYWWYHWLATTAVAFSVAVPIWTLGTIQIASWRRNLGTPAKRLAFINAIGLLLIFGSLAFLAAPLLDRDMPTQLADSLAWLVTPIVLYLAMRFLAVGVAVSMLLISMFSMATVAIDRKSQVALNSLDALTSSTMIHTQLIFLACTAFIIAALYRRSRMP